jgi:alkanesulfonate monooxygenase SsuD/methylene tetrahydromethanopterin reductase-like flavin-dependent oxidoreductase (luciferase family)
MAQTIELGLDTFGDVTAGSDGQPLSQAQSIRNLVLQAELADQVGLAFIGVGEHHRPDFAVSAPEVVLAAIASRTTRIHLGSAVTVLSSDDPVRVFERFSTLNALSNGRAEVIVGAARSPSRCRSSATTRRTTRSCSRNTSTSSPSS